MSVTIRHPQYVSFYDRWLSLRDAYQGQAALTTPYNPRLGAQTAMRTRYLPRPAGMRRDDQYAAYVERTTWLGATERTVQGMTGTVFRREPVIEVPTPLEPHVADITQTGISLRMFAEQAVRETLLMGRFGLMIDYPHGTLTPEGEFIPPPLTSRPYWIPYACENVINWRTIERQGDTLLSLVVLQEVVSIPQGAWGTDGFFVTKDEIRYRVLRLNEAGFCEVSVWREDAGPLQGRTATLMEVWLPLRQNVPLDFLPFTFMAPFSLESDVQKSLIEALVAVNYRHYRHSADYEQSLHYLVPTPYICANIEALPELTIGPSSAWLIPDNQAKVGILQTDPAGLPAHQIALESDKKDMAILGARLLEPQPAVQETLGAVLMRNQGGDSPLQSLVSSVSQGLTWALQVQAWWAGFTENVDDSAIGVRLNKDLVAAGMEPQMLTALTQALLQNTISFETYYHQLQQGEIARPLVDVEDEKELIEIQKEQQPLAPVQPGPLPPGRNGQRVAA